jgi:hypothetical protein
LSKTQLNCAPRAQSMRPMKTPFSIFGFTCSLLNAYVRPDFDFAEIDPEVIEAALQDLP